MAIRLFEEETHAKLYHRYRPVFPERVFQEIVKFYETGKGNTCNYALAVDVGCGNGQSTLPLCKYFHKVIGCDASGAQIELARKDVPNVSYVHSAGEDMTFLENDSIDLINMISALHWLDLDKFYPEVKRVLKPGGVLSAVAHDISPMEPKQASEVLMQFSDGLLGRYWNSRRQLWLDHYRTIPSPFTDWTRIESDDIAMRFEVSVDSFVGILQSWAAWQAYKKEHPETRELENLREKFHQIYEDQNMKVTWPVFIVMCRKPV